MILNDRVARDIKKENITKELFRFQGSGSFQHFDIRNSKFNKNSNYVYFSKSIDHHKYFTLKRIKQVLNKSVLEKSPYQISIFDLSNSFNEIKKLIINSEELPNLYSIKFLCDNNLYNMIVENCFIQDNKANNAPIERADRRVYGGGYGITSQWLDLLSYLTYFSAYQKIDRYDVIDLLTNMKKTNRINRKDNITFISLNNSKYNYKLSPFLESDFTKYKIMNALEIILENKMYEKESSLGKYPKETIKKIVIDYEKNKQKILKLYEKQAQI